MTPAQLRARQLAIRESSRIERWRGSSGCIGVQAVTTILKTDINELYGLRSQKAHTQVPMRAELIDEPFETKTINMLDAAQ